MSSNPNTKRTNSSGGKQQRWKGKKPSNNTSKEIFKGECEDLKGKVYFIGSAKQTDNYNNTTEAILEYFLREYTHGLDVVESLEKLQEKDLTNEVPVEATPPDGASEELKAALKAVHHEEMKQFVQRKQKLSTNLVKAYGIILGQCTKGLKAKLETRKDWNAGNDKIRFNAINLLKAIKEITHNFQDNKYPIESIYFSIRNVFTMKQEDNETLTEFTKRFNNAMDIMETQHGTLAMKAYLETREDYKNATDPAAKDAIVNSEYNKLKAFMYLKALDTKKSGKLVEDLGNQFALGNNQFPTSVTKATETVMAYRNRVNATSQQHSKTTVIAEIIIIATSNNKIITSMSMWHLHKRDQDQ